MVFYATFPWENRTPEDAASDDWLVGVAPVFAFLALVIAGAVIARRAVMAAVASATQFALGAVVLSFALDESDQSDGKLALYASGLAATAAVATAATYLERRAQARPVHADKPRV